MEYLEKLNAIASFIESKTGKAEIGIILGSGLGDYASKLSNSVSIPYTEIPSFPQSTVPGHSGVWHCGELSGKKVFMMQGRFHSYEGYDLKEVTLPIRVMKLLGVKYLIVTNAAGGVNTSFSAGNLMLIEDFINFSGKNPLTGPNYDQFGTRFPDMSQAFDIEMMKITKEVAENMGLNLKKGVYAWFNGPTFETPAEVKMARVLGADAVGMSTVPEVIVAHHAGIRCLGISCITNLAAGILDQPLNHEEVMEAGKLVQNDFRKLIDGVVERL